MDSLRDSIDKAEQQHQDLMDARCSAMKKLRAKGWTLEAIGKCYGITRERVRVILAQAAGK